MTVTIKTYITRETPSENLFRVNVSIIDATNIDIHVLVFDVEHNVFSHVATVYDMESYPADRSQAHTAGLQFYRGIGVTKEFYTVAEAIYFENVTKQRLQILSTSWEQRISEFSGSEYVTITSDPSV